MSAFTRVLGVTALALIALIIAGQVVAKAEDNSLCNITIDAAKAEVIAAGGTFSEWKGDEAKRARSFLEHAGLPYPAESFLMTTTFDKSVILGWVRGGQVCEAVHILPAPWHELELFVEGLPI